MTAALVWFALALAALGHGFLWAGIVNRMHGCGGSRESTFDSTGWLGALSNAGRTPLALHLPGHGARSASHDPASYADLAGSLGLPGQTTHARVLALIAEAVQRAKAVGKPIGTLALTQDAATRYRAMAFDYLAVAGDLSLVMQGAAIVCVNQNVHIRQDHS